MHRPLILRRTTKPDSLIPEDLDVISDGAVVGRIFSSGDTSSRGRAWFWGLAYGNHKGRTPTHGYEVSREAAMAAFAPRAGGWNSVDRSDQEVTWSG